MKLIKCSCRYIEEIPAYPFAMPHSCVRFGTPQKLFRSVCNILYKKKTNEWFRGQLKEQEWCCVALWSVFGVCVIHSWPFKEWRFSFKCSFFFLWVWVSVGRGGERRSSVVNWPAHNATVSAIESELFNISLAKIAEECVLLHVVENWISTGKSSL